MIVNAARTVTAPRVSALAAKDVIARTAPAARDVTANVVAARTVTAAVKPVALAAKDANVRTAPAARRSKKPTKNQSLLRSVTLSSQSRKPLLTANQF